MEWQVGDKFIRLNYLDNRICTVTQVVSYDNKIILDSDQGAFYAETCKKVSKHANTTLKSSEVTWVPSK